MPIFIAAFALILAQKSFAYTHDELSKEKIEHFCDLYAQNAKQKYQEALELAEKRLMENLEVRLADKRLEYNLGQLGFKKVTETKDVRVFQNDIPKNYLKVLMALRKTVNEFDFSALVESVKPPVESALTEDELSKFLKALSSNLQVKLDSNDKGPLQFSLDPKGYSYPKLKLSLDLVSSSPLLAVFKDLNFSLTVETFSKDKHLEFWAREGGDFDYYPYKEVMGKFEAFFDRHNISVHENVKQRLDLMKQIYEFTRDPKRAQEISELSSK